jgi:acyl-CoA synthetase (AMP-forming)/AMP-acid ligase II
MQPDGYVKIKDRSKDVIISGGENISSQEVEDVLLRPPAVMLAAVVAQPDPKWGETPCAFVELKEGASASSRRSSSSAARAWRASRRRRRLSSAPAEDVHRQDPEVPPARARQEHASGRSNETTDRCADA